MSQNIVAICDVDDALIDAKLQSWKDAVAARRARGPARRRRPAGARPSGGAARLAWTEFGPSKARRPRTRNGRRIRPRARGSGLSIEQLPKLKQYRDYREMLDKQKDIDGVVVATPDHMHAVDRVGGDGSRQARLRAEAAVLVGARGAAPGEEGGGQPKIVTQMGNQGHSTTSARRGQEYSAAAPSATSAKCTSGPTARSATGRRAFRARRRAAADPAPLEWNDGVDAAARGGDGRQLPGARRRSRGISSLASRPTSPYHPIYHPFNWRGWVDWGQGALGDMGAHLIDHPVLGLDLGLPTSIETISTPFNGVSIRTRRRPTTSSRRSGMPAVKLTWYDGGLMPPRPEEMGDERLNRDGGVLYIGTKGKMLQDTYGDKPRLLPPSCTTRTARRREACRACRTRTTR